MAQYRRRPASSGAARTAATSAGGARETIGAADGAYSRMNVPLITGALAGVGGVCKREPGDFVVEEIPDEEPCGDGDHLWLWVEKRGLSTELRGAKSFYYLGGLTEGTETIAVFVAMCLFPSAFWWLAWVFGGLCWITTATRIASAWIAFKEPDDGALNDESPRDDAGR